MLTSTLYFHVDERKLKRLFYFNGIKYVAIKCLLPGNVKCDLLFPKSKLNKVRAGKYYYTTKAVLRGDIDSKNKKEYVCLRIDDFEESTKEDFCKQKCTIVNMNGYIKEGEKQVILKGPEARPYIKTSFFGARNEFRKRFSVAIIAYDSIALEICRYYNKTYYNIKGVLQYQYNCGRLCINVKGIEFRQEVLSGESS